MARGGVWASAGGQAARGTMGVGGAGGTVDVGGSAENGDGGEALLARLGGRFHRLREGFDGFVALGATLRGGDEVLEGLKPGEGGADCGAVGEVEEVGVGEVVGLREGAEVVVVRKGEGGDEGGVAGGERGGGLRAEG